MKIVVDRMLCEANGRCVDVCPEVFQLNEEEQLVVLIDEPDARLEAAVRTAVAVCPRQALRVD